MFLLNNIAFDYRYNDEEFDNDHEMTKSIISGVFTLLNMGVVIADVT